MSEATLFVRELLNVDFSYLDAERGLVGETWLVDIELHGELDAQGMVFDFGHIKPLVRQAVETEIDHKLLVPAQAVTWLSEADSSAPRLRFALSSGEHIEHKSPQVAICAIDTDQLTPAAVAQHLHSQLVPRLPANVRKLKLTLRPESIAGAFYHYSHGLRAHAGDCQRIAHGHRSRIEISDGQTRRTDLEQHWARRWTDIYIASQADLRARTRVDSVEYLTFGYSAAQGQFEVKLPALRCEVIDTDSTVELIAAFIAAQLPERGLTVRAFEGVNKGAVAVS